MPRSVLFNRFPEVAAEMVAEANAIVNENATMIEQDVKGGAHAAPVRTGNLRRSYHTEFAGGPTPHAEVGGDLAVAPYGIFVEYGTYKMAARPHLRPATEVRRMPFLSALAALFTGRGC